MAINCVVNMKLKNFIGEFFDVSYKNGCFGVLPKHDSHYWLTLI